MAGVSHALEEEDLSLLPLESIPPSLFVGNTLLESYTWCSDDGPLACDPSASVRPPQRPDIEEDWMMGIDEAGRGSVCGPQVYAVAFAPKSYEEELQEQGYNDSKKLTAAKRKELLDQICGLSDKLKWAVRVMSPHDISVGMLRKMPVNLNEQSHNATMMLIQEVLDRGYRLTDVAVDTVGDPDRYKEKLSKRFPTLSCAAFVVEKKADAKYALVSAASIAAKVTRDACWVNWRCGEGVPMPGVSDLGSGYPGDPATKEFIAAAANPVFGWPNYARFSWNTLKVLLEKNGSKVTWNDEPPSIQRFFQPSDQPSRPQILKDLCLESPAIF